MAYYQTQFKSTSKTNELNSTHSDQPGSSRNMINITEEHPPRTSGQRLETQGHDDRATSRNSILSLHGNDDDLQKSNVKLPPPLPRWIWAALFTILGIGPGLRRKRYFIATFLHILTLLSSFAFGASGCFLNIYDTVSEFTKTTVLVCVAKSVLGLYWIGIGIYSNFLAARLFSNKRMVECIRLHSKTFLKVNTAFIVMLLSVAVVIINLHSSLYLLEDKTPTNQTVIADANCASLGIEVSLCKVYFGSKVVYSFFCLTWNLLVVGIFLSVCRTHTINVRRFMKELLYDTKIYVEYYKIQALERQLEYVQSLSKEPRQTQQSASDFPASPDSNIWDDDINEFTQDSSVISEPSSNARLLQALIKMRITTRDQLNSGIASSLNLQDFSRDDPNKERSSQDQLRDNENEIPEDVTAAASSHLINKTSMEQTASPHHSNQSQGKSSTEKIELPEITISNADEQEDNKTTMPQSSELPSVTMLTDLGPPVMSNEELLFTYFQLLRSFASTSRLLQRWISNWITFVMLWCALLIVHWSSHTAQLSGISQFLIPIVILGFLTSGYAEVNFEGERLLKCVLPTEERMPVFYYFQNSKLELKIFSFTMTYNTIVTVVAGIAVTFATRIILDQFTMGKGQLL